MVCAEEDFSFSPQTSQSTRTSQHGHTILVLCRQSAQVYFRKIRWDTVKQSTYRMWPCEILTSTLKIYLFFFYLPLVWWLYLQSRVLCWMEICHCLKKKLTKKKPNLCNSWELHQYTMLHFNCGGTQSHSKHIWGHEKKKKKDHSLDVFPDRSKKILSFSHS